MRIAAHGLAIDAPGGWDARILRRRPEAVGAAARSTASAHPVLHAANFALPEERGDFGGGAVELMRSPHVLVALLEYDRALAGTALYADKRFPRRLKASAFGPNQLQRTITGQGGAQVFFSEKGRAFCLYVVLGSFAHRDALLPQVNTALERTEIT